MADRTAWTIQEVLKSMQKLFVDRGIESARLDSELLLASVLKTTRVHLYTHYDQPLTLPERENLRGLTKRRLSHEPIAYLLGAKEFYSRSFEVTPETLIPRPETEHLIEVALRRIEQLQLPCPRILDLGTGSGILAVTLALELESSEVVATDLSEGALLVAKRNAARLAPAHNLAFFHGDFYEAVEGQAPFDVIVSNPPYIAYEEQKDLSPDVRNHEPKLALFAKDSGLEALRRVILGAKDHTTPHALTLVEIGASQKDAVETLFERGHENIETCFDLALHPRIVSGQKKI